MSAQDLASSPPRYHRAKHAHAASSSPASASLTASAAARRYGVERLLEARAEHVTRLALARALAAEHV